MSTKSRILVFPFNLLSHYLRCITLVKEYYMDSENEILFISSPEYNDLIKENGFQTFECENFNAKKVMNRVEKFDFSWLNEQDIEKVFLSQNEAIKKYKPTAVIGDTAPALKMAAEINNVEYIALTNGYMTKFYEQTRGLPRVHPLYNWFEWVPKIISDSLIIFGEKIEFRKIHKPFRKIRKRYGLKKVENYLSEMEGDKNIICDLPSLFPQKKMPANYSFVPPLNYKNQTDESDWLNILNKEKPVICICMGASGNWEKLSFLNDSYFSEFTFITAGDRNKTLSGPNIVCREFMNLEQVLKRANIMICHGGNGTLYAGLKSGVYMICLSNHFEQEWNIHAIEKIGYGESANDFLPKDWKQAIEIGLKKALTPFF